MTEPTSAIVKYKRRYSGAVRSLIVSEGEKRVFSDHRRTIPRSPFDIRVSDLNDMGDVEILSVTKNRFFEYPFGGDVGTVSDVQEDDNWGIEYLDGHKWRDKGFRGNGIRVGIADTGLDVTHPCFNQLRLRSFVDIDRGTGLQVEVSPNDSQWHGTFCTAILAGKKINQFERGLADEADLFVAKIFNRFNSSLVAVHSAFEYFIKNDVKIVSLSFGAPNKEDVWAEVVAEYLETGGIVVAGIGNDYTGEAPTISPGNYPLNGLLAVGAHDYELNVWEKSGGGVVDWKGSSSFEGIAPLVKPELCAPGAGIVSIGNNQEFRIGTGTSFATPHVSALLACLWSANPMLSRDEIISELLSSLNDRGAPGRDERYGLGSIEPAKLLLGR